MTFIYIQILRFVAAAAVVFFHAAGTSQAYLGAPGANYLRLFRFGEYGVDIFFVISGFIIYFSAEKGKLTASQFIVRRIERIVPLYWILTLFLLLLAFCLPAVFNASVSSIATRLLESLTFTTFARGHSPILHVGWTLEYEMFFYFSVCALLAFRSRSWDALVVLLSLLVIAMQLPGARTLFGQYSAAGVPLVLEFVFGVIVAKLFLRHSLSRWSLAAALATAGVLLFKEPTNRVILAGLPAAALVLGATRASSRKGGQFPGMALASKLGDASYSIYLIQVFTVPAVCKAAGKFAPGISPEILMFVASILTIAAGYVVYSLVEQPALKACRKMREAWGNWPAAVPAVRPAE